MMMLIDVPRVIFIQVSDAVSKVNCLIQTANEHFSRKEHFLIVTEDDRALSYVDDLLWSHTPELFLPHAIANSEITEWIAITKEKKNINNARFVFNLCSTPLMIQGPFRIIYDFDDGSSPSKKSLSSTRFDAYKKAQFPIESRNMIQR